MATGDLTTLADVKAWMGRTDTNSDSVLSTLVTRASRQILTYLRRGIVQPHTIDEIRDGTGGSTLVLKQWPVVSVSSVTVGPLIVPQAPALSANPSSANACGAGWTYDAWDGVPPGRPHVLSLNGYTFGERYPGAQNNQNILVVYRAGYQVTNESQTVSGGTLTAEAPYGAWVYSISVTYADGTPFEQVYGPPGVGQFQLGVTPGVYIFNAGDNGFQVLLSYAYIPTDLADACIELVCERFKYSERVGEKSHSLGGNETVSFDNDRFTPLVISMLEPYRNVLMA